VSSDLECGLASPDANALRVLMKVWNDLHEKRRDDRCVIRAWLTQTAVGTGVIEGSGSAIAAPTELMSTLLMSSSETRMWSINPAVPG
jgi:hypothetical protein